MKIRICVAGATGWTGSLVTKAILESQDLQLVSAIARKTVGQDVGVASGFGPTGIQVVSDLSKALAAKPQILVDFTKPDSVKERTFKCLASGVSVVIGTSGMTEKDYAEISDFALKCNAGVIAAGNFSITAALAKHFSLIAAQHIPSWEIIDYAHEDKIDAPSGTARELAEELFHIRANHIGRPITDIIGTKEARGAQISGTPVHSIRLPSYMISFETIFGQKDERLTIRHDSGSGAGPYVAGTLFAIRKVLKISGLIRGLDKLLFHSENSSHGLPN